jgi:hypothetical protein
MPEGRLERTRLAYVESTAELLARLPSFRSEDVLPAWLALWERREAKPFTTDRDTGDEA